MSLPQDSAGKVNHKAREEAIRSLAEGKYLLRCRLRDDADFDWAEAELENACHESIAALAQILAMQGTQATGPEWHNQILAARKEMVRLRELAQKYCHRKVIELALSTDAVLEALTEQNAPKRKSLLQRMLVG